MGRKDAAVGGRFRHWFDLSLKGNKVVGALPAFDCPNLEFLDLSANNFSTGFPQFTDCSHLQHLDFSTNKFSGDVGLSLGGCGSLTFLNISRNQFSGGLPSLPAGGGGGLQFVYLSGNDYQGEIPPRFLDGLSSTIVELDHSRERKVINMTKPIVEEAITDLYFNIFPKVKTLCMADLGCSSGPNTLFLVSELIKSVDSIRLKRGHQSPEYQIYLNDLPGNDFNTIFCSLPIFQESLKKRMGSGFGSCFINGVPGSFYDRLLPSRSLHFVHSSYSLQWLSQVPERVENNKGNIYMSSTSPPNVLRAYYEQFQRDFSMFLMCRSEEMVARGRMVLTFLGRRSDDPSTKECCLIWELLAKALNDMVLEGIIQGGKMDSFNIPQYTPSPKEVKLEVEKEGSFMIDRLEVSKLNWSACDKDFHSTLNMESGGYNVAKCMRSVAEPMLASHFGESIIDKLFLRYEKIVTDRMSREKTEFISVTMSMT